MTTPSTAWLAGYDAGYTAALIAGSCNVGLSIVQLDQWGNSDDYRAGHLSGRQAWAKDNEQ